MERPKTYLKTDGTIDVITLGCEDRDIEEAGSSSSATTTNKSIQEKEAVVEENIIINSKPVLGSNNFNNDCYNTSKSNVHYKNEVPIVVTSSNTSSVDNRKEEVWNIFKTYISTKSIPVKLDSFSSWNSNSNNNNSNRKGDTIIAASSSSTNDNDDDINSYKECLKNMNIPKEALESNITVQCHFQPQNKNEERCTSANNDDTTTRKRQKRISLCQSIDSSLTVIKNPILRSEDDYHLPLFLGQGDQPTHTMSLKDALYWDTSNSNVVQLYVAQESILCHHKENQESAIISHSNGTFSSHQHHATNTLSSLAKCLNGPSYLVPNHSIKIQQINLWFSPLSCHTNYHYDTHCNLLCVLHGSKTIELCPPSCIPSCSISSDYANHPTFYNPTSLDYLHSTNRQQRQLAHTNQTLQSNTIVVTIAQGQGLFIPQGWWHHVISSSKCLAFNIWFDYTPQQLRIHEDHMLSFHVRNSLRQYWELHSPSFIKKYLHACLEKMQLERNGRGDRDLCSIPYIQSTLQDIVLLSLVPDDIPNTKPNGSSVIDCSLANKKKQLIHYLNIFLLLLDPSTPEHRTILQTFCNKPLLSKNQNQHVVDAFMNLESYSYYKLQDMLDQSEDSSWIPSFIEFLGGDVFCNYMKMQIVCFQKLIQKELIIDEFLLSGMDD